MTSRLLARALLLAALASAAAPARADERFALIVSGVSGTEKIAAAQKGWVSSLQSTLSGKLGFPAGHLVVLTEDGSGASAATRQGVAGAVAGIGRQVTANDLLLVVLIGHGTFADNTAKFNLVGPDMAAKEWKKLLDGISGRIVFVNTTSSSFPFVSELSAKNRIVITATDSAAQRYDTMFPQYFIEALDKLSAADSDKNGRLSVWEAFAYASQAVKQAYGQQGTLVTERSLLDDNGDGVGKEAAATGADGVLAKTTFLDSGPAASANPAVAALDKQRIALEAQIEELKGRKDQIPEAEYDAQLEKLALELGPRVRADPRDYRQIGSETGRLGRAHAHVVRRLRKTSTQAIPARKPATCAQNATPPASGLDDSAPLKNCITNQIPRKNTAGTSMTRTMNPSGTSVRIREWG